MLSKNFTDLIDAQTSEETVHRFLAEHPEIWQAALPRTDRLLSKINLHRFVPDFVAGTHNRTADRWSWLLIEIEKPGDRILTDRGDPSTKLSHAIKQIADWRNWISENTAYARTILPDIKPSASGLVVIGRRLEITEKHVQSFRAIEDSLNSVAIHTYDWLADVIEYGIERESWYGPLYKGNDWQCGIGWDDVGR